MLLRLLLTGRGMTSGALVSSTLLRTLVFFLLLVFFCEKFLLLVNISLKSVCSLQIPSA